VTLRLYLQAPFVACRTFTAGWYRPTAAFLTPSAAYGLLLNVARVESRLYEGDPLHDDRVPATLTRPDTPRRRLAIGLPEGASPPRVQSMFQQLHNYPVGAQAGVPAELAKGSKNNISPVRREILVNLRAVIAVDTMGDGDLEDAVVRGLRGELNDGRYGLPFVGDNSFLPDRLEIVAEPHPVRWYRRVERADADGPRAGVSRLTWHVDRADMSRTRSALYAPADTAALDPPDDAWTLVGPGEHV
jgi:CRISPR-associated protein Cas5t